MQATQDAGSFTAWGRSPGGENGDPLQDSCLQNPMDRGDWLARVRGLAKSWTRLSDLTAARFPVNDIEVAYFIQRDKVPGIWRI